MPKESVDETIRQYLTYVHDPNSLVDQGKVAELEAAAERTPDLIERLKVYSELVALCSVDIDDIKAKFIKHAAAWAKANDISAEAFRRMNVPEEVLRAAKIVGGAPKKKAETRRVVVDPHSDGTQRRTRVPVERIREHIPATGDFTIKSVAEASGASDATVRKLILELKDRREVTEVGTERAPGARGRGAAVYRCL